MKRSTTPKRTARAASAAASSGRIRPRLALPLLALLLPLACLACADAGRVAISDTYCRDTFYWRTSARDTAETRRQADRHNSRRLCRCESDCL